MLIIDKVNQLNTKQKYKIIQASTRTKLIFKITEDDKAKSNQPVKFKLGTAIRVSYFKPAPCREVNKFSARI